MFLQRLLQFIGWPITAGVIIALLALLVFPELYGRRRTTPAPDSQRQPYGMVSYADAVNRAAPAVVNVYTEKRVIERYQNLSNNPFYRHLYNNSNIPQKERMQKTLGSGVIVDSKGLILTNNHVINGADKIFVMLYDGRGVSAELIGTDPENDLAVLRIELDNLTAIQLADSDKTRVGDVVLAIGNPFGVGQSVTQGIVSATGRWNVGISEDAYRENFIQTDAAINPGNSGGALVDAYGNLVGINTAVLDETNTSIGISFAVPSKTAMETLRQISTHGRVMRGWLGITGEAIPESFGLRITALFRNGPAHIAGVQPNDIITHINGQKIENPRQCMEIVNRIEPNTKVKISLIRDGQNLDIDAIAGERNSSQTKT